MQYLVQPDNGSEVQAFRLQITDVPELFNVVTTPTPVSLPLTYENSQLTLPLCGPGAEHEHNNLNMTWKTTHVRTLFNFVDFALGSTIYQEVNITGLVWVNGTTREVAGGLGIVEVYHR